MYTERLENLKVKARRPGVKETWVQYGVRENNLGWSTSL